MNTVPFDQISGEVAKVNAERIESILAGQASAYRDLVSLNSAAALYISGKSKTLAEGLELSYQSIDSGKAGEVLAAARELSK